MPRHRVQMSSDLQATITAIIARAPEWIRHDLLSKDKSTRSRAEESLAAIVASALNEHERH